MTALAHYEKGITRQEWNRDHDKCVLLRWLKCPLEISRSLESTWITVEGLDSCHLKWLNLISNFNIVVYLE